MSNTAQLLTIDVDAEVQKLCARQFSGPAERLVELVRLAVASGARAVRVSVGVRWATVETLGGEINEAALAGLAIIADGDRSSAERHDALVRCESAHRVALLALLAAPAARVESHGPRGSWALDLVAGALPTVLRRHGAQTEGLKLAVERRGRRGEEVRALARACRFAGIPIMLGGRLLSHGLVTEDCLVEATALVGGLECKVGLPRAGELCQTTLLVHEIVAKELYGLSPRGHTHLAVVRDTTARTVDAIALDRVTELVRDLREQLYQHVRRRYVSLAPHDRAAARELLFRRVERSGDARLLTGVPMFRRLAGAPVDLPAVGAAAHEGTLWAVEPSALRGLGPLDVTGVFVLDRRERELVTEVLGLTLLQPPSSARQGLRWHLNDATRRGRQYLLDFFRGVVGWLTGSRPLHRSALTRAEHGFLMLVSDEITGGRYALPNLPARLSSEVVIGFVERGRLPVQVRRHGQEMRLLLPRRHPRVVAMVRQVERDAWILYPALAALFGGYDGYGVRKGEVQGQALRYGSRTARL